ncbi:MAG: 30S ribosomal protein S19, partial [Patescibacteria group bacterium]
MVRGAQCCGSSGRDWKNLALRGNTGMSRSLKKGPFVDPNVLKKIARQKPEGGAIKTWARASEISPEMVGYTFAIHNGKIFIEVRVTEEMVGHRLGEFSLTRKFVRHGGKMQKEIDQKVTTGEGAAPAGGGKAAAAPA